VGLHLDYSLSCALDTTTNKLLLVSVSDYRMRYTYSVDNTNLTNNTAQKSLYLFEYTNEYIPFGFTSMSPIKYIGSINTSTGSFEKNVNSILLSNNSILIVYASTSNDGNYYIYTSITSDNGVSYTQNFISTYNGTTYYNLMVFDVC